MPSQPKYKAFFSVKNGGRGCLEDKLPLASASGKDVQTYLLALAEQFG
jgi:hypothetical protein